MNTQQYGQPSQNQPFLKKSTIVWGIVGLFVIILLVGGCTSYNGLVKERENVNLAWEQVQSAYQRRFDLLPQVVDAVKKATKEEKATLENVTDARAGITPEQQKLNDEGDALVAERKKVMAAANGPDAQGAPIEQLEKLNRQFSIYVNAVHEAYPELQFPQLYGDLMAQLESTENGIKTERDKYSAAVRNYNVTISTFPRSMLAGLFGFERKNGFVAESDAQTMPNLNIND